MVCSRDAGTEVIAQYEYLRAQEVAKGASAQSLGYAFFTRRGMAAWAYSWHGYALETSAPARTTMAQNPLPLELSAQIALVLAGIIFNLRRQEVCSCWQPMPIRRSTHRT